MNLDLARLAALSPDMRATVMRRLRANQPMVGTDDPAQVPEEQLRLWLSQQLTPDEPVYNLVGAMRLRGGLDTAAMRSALAEITRRHEALRMSFHSTAGVPVRRVAAEVSVPLTVSSAATDDAALAAVTELAREPFDLTRAPLARYLLVRVARREHMFGFVAHHLVSDGWSFAVFARELVHLYESFHDGVRPSLPALDPTNRHVARSEPAPDDLRFWRSVLAGPPPFLDLPVDRPRSETQTFHGRLYGYTLTAELTAALRRRCAEQGRTVFTHLLAGFVAFLNRITGQRDIVVGTPVAGRDSSAAEQMIGFFVRTLPIRIQVGAAGSYDDLARQVHETVGRAFAHQNVSFDQIVRAVAPPRDPRRPVLRQVAFALQELPIRSVRVAGVEFATVPPTELDTRVARLDVSAHMWEDGDRLAGYFEYNTDLFDEATVAGWVSRFIGVLTESVLTPTAEVGPPRSNLTESQELFYFAGRLRTGERLYYEHVTSVFTIRSPVEPDRLRAAVQSVVDRSDALRSVIDEVDGVPMRRVLDSVPVALDVVDLSKADDTSAAVAEWVAARDRRDLTLAERLFDTALLLCGETAVWYLSVHHLVSDAWSTALILRYVAECYERIGPSTPADLPPLPAYQDYVDHEREFRQSDRYRRSARYWRETLAEPASRLTFYRSPDSVGTTRVIRRSVDIGAMRTRLIHEFARTHGLTSPATVFAATLFVFLHRITGETFLRVGTPFANRPAAFRDTIGLFMNACPVTVRVTGDEDLRTVAANVQVALFEAARHQEVPVRNPVDNPVYDVYFNYQNTVFKGFGGTVEADILGTGHSNERLALQVRDFSGTGRFVLDFDFNVQCFPPEERERSVTHYLTLLDALLDDSTQGVHRPEVLTEPEIRRLVADLNRTDRPYDLDVPLHAFVEAQVTRTPDATSVVFEDRRLTYRELDTLADDVARRLRAGGIGPGSIVGVRLERSADLVVALLGVLKSGAAYLPLDPEQPTERTEYLLHDSGAAAVLTHPRADEPTVRLTHVGEGAMPRASAAAVTGHHAAYVMYTSGSTGQPKAAVIQHRAIVNRILWMQDEYRLEPTDRVLQKTPFTFDVSVWEFFWPLLAGACLVVARPGGHQDPRYLVRTIQDHRVTTLHFVPSMLRVFLDTPGVAGCSTVRRVFSSGEALPADLPKRFFALFDAELHNLYGPTEAAVDVTYWQCRPGSDDPRVPIGRPVANTQLYVLDGHGDLLPAGVTGELYIGGVQVASGYLNRRGLTAARFVPDPFRPGGRLYRTGDLVRYRPDGALDFLGRTDDQVKLRGIRVEPGEVEAALRGLPEVRAAVVSVWREQLVAHVELVAGAASSPADLRAALATRLPAHLIPAFVIVVPEWPVNANGKLDRRALPTPDGTMSTGSVAPRNELERSIADLWAAELGRKVGVFDNFFDIGGHSLMAARLMSRLGRLLATDLPLATLFRAPTVAALAALAEGGEADFNHLVPITNHGALPPLYVIHPAGGDVLAYRELAARIGPDRPVIGIQSRGLAGRDEYDGIDQMAAAYADAIRAHQPHGPYLLAGWSMGGVVALSVARALEDAGATVTCTVLIDSYCGADSSSDPLLPPMVALADAVGRLDATPTELDELRQSIRGTGIDGALAAVASWARKRGATVGDNPLATLRAQADLVVRHEKLLAAHHPPVVRCSLGVYVAEQRLHSRRTDWTRHTTGPVHHDTVPGNHFTLLRPPFVDTLATRLTELLDGTRPAEGTHR